MQVAYAIGKAEPVGLFVETFGTETVDVDKIADAITQVFDLRPAAIIRDLDLKRPIYAKTAAYGHFGREDADFTWERTDRAEQLGQARQRLSRAPTASRRVRPPVPSRSRRTASLRAVRGTVAAAGRTGP